MTKIAIISQAEQGVLIDISGCSSLSEAKQYLTSTLQVSSQFWEGLVVDLNLGPLVLTAEQVNEIQAIVSEVGVQPRQIFSSSPITRASLIECRLPIAPVASSQAPAATPCRQLDSQEKEITTVAIASCADFVPGEIAVFDREKTADPASVSVDPTEGTHDSVQLPPGVASLPDLFLQARMAAALEAAEVKAAEVKAASTDPVPFIGEESRTVAKASTATAAPVPGKTQKQQPAVLMMKQTLRSGQRVSHKGHLVIIGDVNPGAELVADGDITVWGALRGMAHAGASGNSNAEIRALKFEPIQLRIAQAIARSPDRSKPVANMPSGPETARVIDGKIRIAGSEPE